jgi:hypothetical protein
VVLLQLLFASIVDAFLHFASMGPAQVELCPSTADGGFDLLNSHDAAPEIFFLVFRGIL